jgi:hypothetical protein
VGVTLDNLTNGMCSWGCIFDEHFFMLHFFLRDVDEKCTSFFFVMLCVLNIREVHDLQQICETEITRRIILCFVLIC